MKFETPEDLEDAITDYLEWVKEQNEPRVMEFCKKCGKIRKRADSKCCGLGFEHRLVHPDPAEKIRPTYYGFAAWAGTTRKTLWEYSKRDDFAKVLDWFKTILQADVEQILLNPHTKNVQGAKFVAINNYGWAERQEISGKGGGPVEVREARDKLARLIQRKRGGDPEDSEGSD